MHGAGCCAYHLNAWLKLMIPLYPALPPNPPTRYILIIDLLLKFYFARYFLNTLCALHLVTEQ